MWGRTPHRVPFFLFSFFFQPYYSILGGQAKGATCLRSGSPGGFEATFEEALVGSLVEKGWARTEGVAPAYSRVVIPMTVFAVIRDFDKGVPALPDFSQELEVAEAPTSAPVPAPEKARAAQPPFMGQNTLSPGSGLDQVKECLGREANSLGLQLKELQAGGFSKQAKDLWRTVSMSKKTELRSIVPMGVIPFEDLVYKVVALMGWRRIDRDVVRELYLAFLYTRISSLGQWEYVSESLPAVNRTKEI